MQDLFEKLTIYMNEFVKDENYLMAADVRDLKEKVSLKIYTESLLPKD